MKSFLRFLFLILIQHSTTGSARAIQHSTAAKPRKKMKDSTKKTLKRVAEIVITIITALLTTLGAHATGIVQ